MGVNLMKRRKFIALMGGAAVAWSLAASAQPPKVVTIGVLVRGAPGWQQFWDLFHEALRELGYIEGTSVRFEFRSDEGELSRLPGLAAELVRLKVDVIVTWYTPAAIAAKQATRDIPVVCAICGDLVATGLAESLARPGGNVTGSSSLGAEISGKIVELIGEMLPSVHQIAVLANAPDPWSKVYVKQIQQAGEATGIAINPIMIHSAGELEPAFRAMERQRPDAIIVQPSLPTNRVAQLALSRRIPTACPVSYFVREGGLMSYYSVEADLYRRAAVLVDKILKGAKPADLPVEQPTKFELAINLKTVRALGLSIPPSLLARADEVIE
jgi:putative tryptophan/tyrosine transport system substrate-binding protein